MKEKLKNELLIILNDYVDNDNLKSISIKLDLLLSDYDISLHKNEVIPYSYTVPETVKIYMVTKKIAGLSMKSLYLYNIVLNDFFNIESLTIIAKMEERKSKKNNHRKL